MRAEATAITAGDPRQDGMNQLSRELYAPVLRWATRWVETADEAEDIAQDAMIKLLTRIESFRGQGQVESWMYRVTRNTAISAQRRRSARQRAEGRFMQCCEPEALVHGSELMTNPGVGARLMTWVDRDTKPSCSKPQPTVNR